MCCTTMLYAGAVGVVSEPSITQQAQRLAHEIVHWLVHSQQSCLKKPLKYVLPNERGWFCSKNALEDNSHAGAMELLRAMDQAHLRHDHFATAHCVEERKIGQLLGQTPGSTQVLEPDAPALPAKVPPMELVNVGSIWPLFRPLATFGGEGCDGAHSFGGVTAAAH
eukprot:4756938-Amphidinium_carterae.1